MPQKRKLANRHFQVAHPGDDSANLMAFPFADVCLRTTTSYGICETPLFFVFGCGSAALRGRLATRLATCGELVTRLPTLAKRAVQRRFANRRAGCHPAP